MARIGDMGIGIGGGLGPFRAGISTRGVGGGVGPVSMGTSWGRSGRGGGDDDMGGCALLIGVVLVLAAIYYVLAWPYLLGGWLAVKLGADNPSVTRTVVAWLFEGVWIALLISLAVMVLLQFVADRRASLRASEFDAQYGAEIDDLKEFLATAPAVHAEILEAGDAIREALAGLQRGPLPGSPAVFGRAPAALVAPRVQERGTGPVQSIIDHGIVTVTGRAVQFSGEHKSAQWVHAQVTNQRRTGGRLMIDVSTRATVMGLEGINVVIDCIEALADVASGGVSIEEGRARVSRALAEVADLLSSLDQEVGESRARLRSLLEMDPARVRKSRPVPDHDANTSELREEALVIDLSPVLALPLDAASPPVATANRGEPASLVPTPSVGQASASTPAPQGMNVSVQWGKKAERAAAKAWPVVATWLDPDEHITGVVRVAKIIPNLDLLFVTDRRVLACSSKPDSVAGAPVSVLLAQVERVEISNVLHTLIIREHGGLVHKVGSLHHEGDVALARVLLS